MPYPRNGFTPLTRPSEGDIRNLPAAASTNQPISVGDAVTLVNGVIVPCTAGVDPGIAGYGVVVAVYTTANRPLTHQTNKIIVSGGVGRVDVIVSPEQEYVVRCDTSVAQTIVGKNLSIDVSAANAALGTSGQCLANVSASLNNLFQVVALYNGEELGGKEAGFGVGQGVIVRWNRHALKAATAGL